MYIFYLDPSISVFLYNDSSRSYSKTVKNGSFNQIRRICLKMGGDLAIFGIHQNNSRK